MNYQLDKIGYAILDKNEFLRDFVVPSSITQLS